MKSYNIFWFNVAAILIFGELQSKPTQNSPLGSYEYDYYNPQAKIEIQQQTTTQPQKIENMAPFSNAYPANENGTASANKKTDINTNKQPSNTSTSGNYTIAESPYIISQNNSGKISFNSTHSNKNNENKPQTNYSSKQSSNDTADAYYTTSPQTDYVNNSNNYNNSSNYNNSNSNVNSSTPKSNNVSRKIIYTTPLPNFTSAQSNYTSPLVSYNLQATYVPPQGNFNTSNRYNPHQSVYNAQKSAYNSPLVNYDQQNNYYSPRTNYNSSQNKNTSPQNNSVQSNYAQPQNGFSTQFKHVSPTNNSDISVSYIPPQRDGEAENNSHNGPAHKRALKILENKNYSENDQSKSHQNNDEKQHNEEDEENKPQNSRLKFLKDAKWNGSSDGDQSKVNN